MKDLPSGQKSTRNDIELHYHYDDLEPVRGAPYKLVFNSGQVLQGVLDQQGYALIPNAPPGRYRVELGEDERDYIPPPLEPDADLQRARNSRAQAERILQQERLHTPPAPFTPQ